MFLLLQEPSADVVEQALLLDLCYEEDAAAAVDFNVVMTGRGDFIELQGTAEGQQFNQETLFGLVALARTGIESLLARQAVVLETVGS